MTVNIKAALQKAIDMIGEAQQNGCPAGPVAIPSVIADAFRSLERGDEMGWLIELKPSFQPTPTYYGENGEGVLGWTADNLRAIRFARKEDAELVIECEGFTEAFACEHGWYEFRGKPTLAGRGGPLLGS